MYKCKKIPPYISKYEKMYTLAALFLTSIGFCSNDQFVESPLESIKVTLKVQFYFQGSSDQCPVHCHDSRSRHTDHTCEQMISDQMIMSRSRHADEQAVVEQLLRQELSNFNETVSHFGWFQTLQKNVFTFTLWRFKILLKKMKWFCDYYFVLHIVCCFSSETDCDQIVIILLPCHSVTLYSYNIKPTKIYDSL